MMQTMGAPTSTGYYSNQLRSNVYTDPAGNRGFGPGMIGTNSPSNDNPMWRPQQGMNTQMRQAFLPPELMSPFYNAQGVNANLGTMFAGMMPQVQSHISSVLNPALTANESNFLNTTAQDASELMERMMTQQEAMYRGTPFHSAVPGAQAEVFDQFNRNLLQTGSQLAMQRLQTANQVAAMPIAGLQQSIDYGPQMAERLFNLSNQAYAAPYQIPLQVYSQLPFNSPTLVQSGGGGGGKGFG